jgi:hypothetical protein
MRGILKNEDVLQYIKAGNATITILNTKSGNRFTFNIKKVENKEIFYVKVLTSPDIYSFIGTFFNDNSFKYSLKSHISKDAQSVLTFEWLVRNINNLPSIIEIYHEGKCGKCGRKLTVPESITSGYGPDCIRRINNIKK